MSFGIAFAGGGIRGAAHVGVLLALEEHGLVPSAVAGTSAGGLVAGLYAAGLPPARMREIILELSRGGASFADPDLRGILSMIPNLLCRKPCANCSGLLKGDRMEDYLCRITGGILLREIPMRVIIPAVDLISSQTVAFTNSLFGVRPAPAVRWYTNARLCDAMRATVSLPGIFRPKEISGMVLVDGGVADVLPVDLLVASGCLNVLAVDVSDQYRMPERIDLPSVIFHSLAIMETRLRECMTRGERYLLNPAMPETTGVLALEEMSACMEAGYAAATQAMPHLWDLFR